jgi:hypothetical protein
MAFGLLRHTGGIVTGQPINWAHPLNRGLVSWWLTLPGAYGRAFKWFDLCNRNHGTLTNMDPGTDWVGPQGRRGGWGALSFDGTDDSVQMPQSTILKPTTAITAAAWVRAADVHDTQPVLTWDGGSVDAYRLQLKDAGGVDSVTFLIGTTAATKTYTAGTKFLNGTWYHLVGTYDGANVRIYVDGIEEASTALTGNITYNPFGDQRVYIGSSNTVSSFRKGLIDDVRIYNRALSAGDVAWLYQLSQQYYPGLLNRIPSWKYAEQAAVAAVGGPFPHHLRRASHGGMITMAG